MALNKVIVIGSPKGGVGKTSSIAALADIISRKQKRSVLVIDTDPMGNLSSTFGYLPSCKTSNNLSTYLVKKYVDYTGDADEISSVTYYINKARKYVPGSDIRQDYENLDIITSNGSLSGIYNVVNAYYDANYLFCKLIYELRSLDKYDYIFVDTRPVIDNFLIRIMFVADYLLVPSTDSLFSFMGANTIGNEFVKVKEKRKAAGDKSNIKFLGMFLNMVTMNTKTERDLRGDGIKKYWGDNPVFGTIIEFNQAVKNADRLLAPVTTAFPSSIAAKEFNALAREVVAKVEGVPSTIGLACG